ncbi:hypothetical protein Aple_052190 [Acrocarpospora pleiomorpha]|uniref:Uncharacterized protein n=1 Tax=Acrocarpospora pleiomorpha TaxID=90975 RepID=A0A5M3XN15_9ACTN|nr:hypothetical protein [Acrocarpospora pleiomorpha]GES22322.1 hypothetical protein Aple_052190 [Acrocarpospora pleiomorpha]
MNISIKFPRTATASLIIALAVGFVTVTAGPSSADVPGRVIVTESSDRNSDDKGAEVTCPDGTRVLGTGAEISGGVGGSVIIDQVIPTAYTVSAYGVETPAGTTASWVIRVWAVCGNPRTTTYIRYQATASHPNPKTLGLACHEGDWLLGSGFQLEGVRGNVSVTGLIPTLDDVFVETKENHRGYAGNYYLRVFVICAEDAPAGLQVVSEESDENSDDKGSVVPCPDDKQALSAGFSIPGAAGETVLTYFIPNNPTAIAYAHELSSTTREWSVRTYATCAFE